VTMSQRMWVLVQDKKSEHIQTTHGCPTDYMSKIATIIISTSVKAVIVDIVNGVGDEQTSQQASTGAKSKPSTTAQPTLLGLRLLHVGGLLTVSAIALLSIATAIPLVRTEPSETRAVARSTTTRFQETQETTGSLPLLFIPFVRGVPPALLSVPRAWRKRTTHLLRLRGTPLSVLR